MKELAAIIAICQKKIILAVRKKGSHTKYT